MSERFSIKLNSSFVELWRYNIAIVAACFDANGEQLEVKSARSHIADVGANLKTAPEGYDRHRELSVLTNECESVEALIYLVPHTLPVAKEIVDVEPFNVHIVAQRGDVILHDEKHAINQWAGDSISLKF